MLQPTGISTVSFFKMSKNQVQTLLHFIKINKKIYPWTGIYNYQFTSWNTCRKRFHFLPLFETWKQILISCHNRVQVLFWLSIHANTMKTFSRLALLFLGLSPALGLRIGKESSNKKYWCAISYKFCLWINHRQLQYVTWWFNNTFFPRWQSNSDQSKGNSGSSRSIQPCNKGESN